MKRFTFTIALLAALASCKKTEKKTEAEAPPAAAAPKPVAPAPAAPAPAPAAAPKPVECDVAAFEKEQEEKGRESGAPKAFVGCKFDHYNEKTRTVFIAKGAASDSMSCVNVDKPDVANGELVDIDGNVDGSMSLQLYGCK